MNIDRQSKLEGLHDEIRACTACRLHENRTHAVPGEGGTHAPIMMVGEAPGKEEDLSGRPFCGPAGDFFDLLLADAGIPRDDLYVTSAVKCRPPGNRNPRMDELETCRELWLWQQIELVDPDLIVLLGKVPALQILGERGRLRDLHGNLRTLNGRHYLPTYHPAAAMRFPEPEEGLREDFQQLADFL